MQFKALPEKKENGKDNVIRITNTALDEENPTVFEIPGTRFEYPFPETEEEMYQLCGGRDKLLVVFRDHIRDDSVNAGKTKIRVAATGTSDEIIASGLKETKEFTYIESTKVTASEAKSIVSRLQSLASEDISEEELGRRVLKELGLVK